MFHAHFKNKVAIFLNAHGLLQPAILSRYSFIPGSTRVATTYKGYKLATYIENLFITKDINGYMSIVDLGQYLHCKQFLLFKWF